MPHPFGANIGGARTVEDVRLRCVCDAHTGCWHLRMASGRPMPVDKVHRVHVHGLGVVSATRWVWEAHHNRRAPSKHIVFRACDSYDCVNPEHLRCGPKAALGAKWRREGRFSGLEFARRAAELGRSRAVLTPEFRTWIADSVQSNSELAHVFGVTHQRIATIRREAKARAGQAPASVFAWAQSMARAA